MNRKPPKQFQARHFTLYNEMRPDTIQICDTSLHGKIRDTMP